MPSVNIAPSAISASTSVAEISGESAGCSSIIERAGVLVGMGISLKMGVGFGCGGVGDGFSSVLGTTLPALPTFFRFGGLPTGLGTEVDRAVRRPVMTGENDEHEVEFGTTHSATGPCLRHLPTLAHLPARPPTHLPAHARLPACWPPANARSSAHTLPPAHSWSQSARL